MHRTAVALTLVLVALLLGACGGGGSSSTPDSSTSSSAGGAKTPEQVWAKELEGVMRRFENSSSKSVALIHTSTSQYNLEPMYATYSAELKDLGKQLEATKPPANCEHLRDEMGALSDKVSEILGVLAHQDKLSPEEYAALTFQQRYKFAKVGRRLTDMTIHPHC
jgi:hypothetical protein